MIFASPNLINQAVGGMPLPRLRRSTQQPMELKEEVVRDGNHKVNSNGNPRIENSGKNNVSRGQGCISCGILLSGTGARGVSSEHMENMEMFSCSLT